MREIPRSEERQSRSAAKEGARVSCHGAARRIFGSRHHVRLDERVARDARRTRDMEGLPFG